MNQESSTSRVGLGLLLTAAAGAALFVACGGNNATPPDPCAPNGRQIGESCMCDPGFIPLGLNCLPIGGGGGGGGGGSGNDAGQNNPDGSVVTDPDGGMTDPDGGMDRDGGMTDPDGGTGSDGGTDAGYVCGPTTCDTCCVNNVCVSVSNNLTCGSGGNACQTCSGSQQCNAGVCQTASTCGPGNCSGCCQGNTCVTGNTASACGTGGGVCASCSGSQTCQGGVCASTSNNCGVIPSFGNATLTNQFAQRTILQGVLEDVSYFASLNGDQMPDELSIQLYDGFGAYATGIRTGPVQLTGAEANYESCGACVFVYANTDFNQDPPASEHVYLATSGTLMINSVDGGVSGTLQNATFQKIVNLPDGGIGHSSDGCATSISFASFNAPY